MMWSMPWGGDMPPRPSWFAPKRPHVFSAQRTRIAWQWEWTGRLVRLVRRAIGEFPTALHAAQALLRSDAVVLNLPTIGGPDGIPPLPHGDAKAWGKRFPQIAEWMTASAWPDGKPREGCRLVLSVRNQWWRLTLKEPNLGLEVEVTSENPDELYPALESLLSTKKVPWRHDQWAQVNRKKPKSR